MARSREILVRFHENLRWARRSAFAYPFHIITGILLVLARTAFLWDSITGWDASRFLCSREVWSLSRDILTKSSCSLFVFSKKNCSFCRDLCFCREFVLRGRSFHLCFLTSNFISFAKPEAFFARFCEADLFTVLLVLQYLGPPSRDFMVKHPDPSRGLTSYLRDSAMR